MASASLLGVPCSVSCRHMQSANGVAPILRKCPRKPFLATIRVKHLLCGFPHLAQVSCRSCYSCITTNGIPGSHAKTAQGHGKLTNVTCNATSENASAVSSNASSSSSHGANGLLAHGLDTNYTGAATSSNPPSSNDPTSHLVPISGDGAGAAAAELRTVVATSTLTSTSASAAGGVAAGRGGGCSGPGGLLDWIWRVVKEQYLPVMLLSALLAAAVQPSWGLAAARTNLLSAVTFTIFVLQGVMLRRGEAEKALGATGAISWGLAAILALTPLAAPLAGALPLQPPGLALGLLVFACMPTTLSSGVALTQVVGGNTALALLLTISSNLAAVFTLPLTLPAALKATAALGGFGATSAASSASTAASAVRLDPMPLLIQLVQCILLPTLLGAGLRGLSAELRGWVDANRRTLSVVSGALLSLVPWMQVSKALAQGVVVAPASLAAAVAWSLAFHAAYLALNTAAVQVFQLGGTDPRVAAPTRRALIVVASQKTLPVALAVLARLGPAVGAEAAGCAAVAAVFSHLAQTCADFWLVARWTEHIRRREQAEAVQAQEAIAAGAAAKPGRKEAEEEDEGSGSIPVADMGMRPAAAG